MDTGSQLRLRGEGESGEHGGPPGDLFVVIHVKEHEFFRREEDDLICQVPISFVQAALGDTLSIPLLDDEAGHELVIPQGTQPGEIIKIPGKGMASLRGYRRRGDLYVKIDVKIPKKINNHQRELLEAFAETEGLAPTGRKKGHRGFWKKMAK